MQSRDLTIPTYSGTEPELCNVVNQSSSAVDNQREHTVLLVLLKKFKLNKWNSWKLDESMTKTYATSGINCF